MKQKDSRATDRYTHELRYIRRAFWAVIYVAAVCATCSVILNGR